MYIVDANEEIIPHKKSVSDEDIEEERRMFYVAMTRARKRLRICSIGERYNKELSISRFVNEMLFDVEKLKPGCRVYHKKYHSGLVKSIQEDKITVYFQESKRTFVFSLSYCIGNHILDLEE